jgi:aspartate racemase
MSETKCLGLVGGLGVGATIHYYEQLAAACQMRQEPMRLLIVHADVSRVLSDVKDGNLAALAQYLAGLMRQLADGGADFAAIAAITPHICFPELARITPLPIVNLVDEVARTVRTRGLRRVALFGTRATVESGMFGQLSDLEIATPRAEEVDQIHNAYVEIVAARRGTPEIFQTLTDMAHRLRARDGAEAIVLAGTELSLVFNEANTDFPAIDCARVHLDAIMGALHG